MTPKQQRALRALLSYPTQKEAAKAAGITDRTMRNYLEDPTFKEAYRKAVSSLLNDATRQTQQALNPAISTLQEIAEDGDERSSTRVAASRAILDYSLRFTELTDVIERIERLEERQGIQGK